MDFVVAIPSYKRAVVLKEKTLTFLANSGFLPQWIYIFVASAEEKVEYEKTLTPNSYKEIVVGVPTLARQRQFIIDYFYYDQNILACDDDIKRIKLLTNRPLVPIINQLFSRTRAAGLSLWGIYPVNNLYFCKERLQKGFLYIVGCFYGFVNKKDILYPDVSCAEDKWLSIVRFQKDGGVFRYEGACPDTAYYAKGGLTDARSANGECVDKNKVQQMFPDITKIKKKKNGRMEVIWKPLIFEISGLQQGEALD
jgi:hypothetical protein